MGRRRLFSDECMRKASFGKSPAEQAARVVLTDKRKGLRALLPFLGPAFIAAVA